MASTPTNRPDLRTDEAEAINVHTMLAGDYLVGCRASLRASLVPRVQLPTKTLLFVLIFVGASTSLSPVKLGPWADHREQDMAAFVGHCQGLLGLQKGGREALICSKPFAGKIGSALRNPLRVPEQDVQVVGLSMGYVWTMSVGSKRVQKEAGAPNSSRALRQLNSRLRCALSSVKEVELRADDAADKELLKVKVKERCKQISLHAGRATGKEKLPPCVQNREERGKSERLMEELARRVQRDNSQCMGSETHLTESEALRRRGNINPHSSSIAARSVGARSSSPGSVRIYLPRNLTEYKTAGKLLDLLAPFAEGDVGYYITGSDAVSLSCKRIAGKEKGELLLQLAFCAVLSVILPRILLCR